MLDLFLVFAGIATPGAIVAGAVFYLRSLNSKQDYDLGYATANQHTMIKFKKAGYLDLYIQVTGREVITISSEESKT